MWYLIGYLVGFVVLWPIAANSLFKYSEGRWPTMAKDVYKEDIVFAVLLGFLTGLWWPLAVPGFLVGAVIVRLNKKPL